MCAVVARSRLCETPVVYAARACVRARTLYVRAMATTTIGESSLSAPAAPSIERAGRVASVDLIRGAVMILMAIDHVRVYSGLPAGGPTPGIFFTRWITHFCAPAFIFLAGTSAARTTIDHPITQITPANVKCA